MTNYEKYHDELINILSKYVSIKNGKIIECQKPDGCVKCDWNTVKPGMSCHDRFYKWIDEEYNPDPGWPIDAKVIVWNYENIKARRHYAGFENGRYLTFCEGVTSFTRYGVALESWRHAELYEGGDE